MNNTVKIDRVGLGAAILLSAIAATGVASAQTASAPAAPAQPIAKVMAATDLPSCLAAANAMPAGSVSGLVGYCQTKFQPAPAPPPLNLNPNTAQGSTTTVMPIKPL